MRVGVDVGGTFTDFVAVTGDAIRHHKVLSTPEAPGEAILQGLADLHLPAHPSIVHGSTVATNAFLERKGARVALVATRGFEDVLAIGRQQRFGIYSLRAPKPEPLVPPERRVGVSERLGPAGEVITPLRAEEVASCLARLTELEPEAVAVVLLHAYANPAHEEMLGKALAQRFPCVFLSSRVHPEHREYERTSTTVLTAYVAPRVEGYLRRLAAAIGPHLRVMSSAGGHESPQRILAHPAALMLSGPAGGVVGALHLARHLGIDRVVTFDMGGTSTDVSMVAGSLPITREAEFDHLPLRFPMVDVHTVGAGGGSLARFDLGGSLRVGPESQGARPGPACYGLGGEFATVTDAHLLLGRLEPAHFLGGRLSLDFGAAEAALRRLKAAAPNAVSAVELAEGILTVANATMERAIRRVTAQRGVDPAGFALVCYGGAGGLHAATLAARLGMREVLVPPRAGTFSAEGLVHAAAIADHLVSVLLQADDRAEEEVRRELAALAARGREELQEEGFAPAEMTFERFLDLRYEGQSYELQTPWQGSLTKTVALFHELHAQHYLHASPSTPVEVVNAYVRVLVPPRSGSLPLWPAGGHAAPFAVRDVAFRGGRLPTPLYARSSLPAGWQTAGPALLFDDDASTLVPPGFDVSLDRHGVLHITWREART